jgi:hypothetical protein
MIYTHEDERPHVDPHICGKCRKPFVKGDRVTQAYIFSHRGVNPLNLGNTGAHLFEEYELVHIDCTDPLLKKGGHNG